MREYVQRAIDADSRLLLLSFLRLAFASLAAPMGKTSLMRRITTLTLLSALLFVSVSGSAPQRVNPLLSPSTLPFQAPPFDKIKDGDFAPAFEAGNERATGGGEEDRR